MSEFEWNCATRSQKNEAAEDAGLLRRSSFLRDLPLWRELPQEWKDKLDSGRVPR